jgi:hypothetical protein
VSCDNQASAPANIELASVGFRRTLLICPASRPGFLSDHRAVAQPWRRERVFVLRFSGRLGRSGAVENGEAGVRKVHAIGIVCTR